MTDVERPAEDGVHSGGIMIVTLLIVQALHASSSPSLLQSYPAEVMRNEVVAFKPQAAHHFSLEAPQNCGSGKLVEKTPRHVKCQFTQSGEAQATLNVCDDKKTFCKPIAAALKVSEQAGAQSEILVKNESLNQELKKTLVPGFKSGRPEEIKKEAAAAGKPVFVMISTDWCPPCNEAKEHLFQTKMFEAVSAGWFKVYVDGDNLQAAEWEKVVPYKFFPSFVMLNSKFEEMGRYTGPLRQSNFETWAKEVASYNGDSISDLRARVLARRHGGLMQRMKDVMNRSGVQKRSDDEARLLKWALDQNDAELVAQLAHGAKFPALDADLTYFELSRLQEEADRGGEDKKELRIELHQRLLKQLLTRDGWALSWVEFCEYDSKACAAQAVHVRERIENITTREGLSAAEKASLLGEEYSLMRAAYEMLGKKAEEKEMALKCVAAYEQMSAASSLKQSRSSQQGSLSCLEAAGQTAKAESALKSLIAAYPNEATFLIRMARHKRKAKQLKPALEWITKAEKVAYGYNWFNTQLLKADILMELKRGAEAKALLAEALGQVQLGADQDSRNQSVVSRLRAAQTKAEASLKASAH